MSKNKYSKKISDAINETLSYRIRHFPVIRNILSFSRNIQYGVSNLVRWTPVIWNDRDWDHYYFYVILKKKLESMLNEHTKYNPFEDKDVTIDYISTAVELVNKLMKDSYLSDSLDKLEAKYGKVEYEHIPCKDNPGFIELVDKSSDEYIEARLKAYKEADNQRDKDRFKLFNILYSKLDSWWI